MKFLLPLLLTAVAAFGQSNSIQLWDRAAPHHYMKLSVDSLGGNYTTTFSGGNWHFPGDIYLSPDDIRIFGHDSSVNFQGKHNRAGTRLVFYPTTGTAPTDTITEMDLYRTSVAQEQAGVTERLDFAAILSPIPSYFIQEEAIGLGANYYPLLIMAGPQENMRFMPDLTTYLGLGSTTSLETLILQNLSAGLTAGTYDSHKFRITGFSNNGSTHNADWRMYDRMTSTAGSSSFVIQTRIDGASYADKILISDTGTLSTAAGGVQMGTATQPSCAAGTRGTFWYVAGGAGVKDTVNLCTKDAADAYAWRSIY